MANVVPAGQSYPKLRYNRVLLSAMYRAFKSVGNEFFDHGKVQSEMAAKFRPVEICAVYAYY